MDFARLRRAARGASHRLRGLLASGSLCVGLRVAVLFLTAACGGGVSSEAEAPEAIACGDVFELALRHPNAYANPFLDVRARGVVTAPDGTHRQVPGFYDGEATWKLRLRPDRPGRWSWTFTLAGPEGSPERASGSFTCTSEGATRSPSGTIRRHAHHAQRWIQADGSPWLPLGLQDCVYFRGGAIRPLEIDGEMRREARQRRLPPEEYFRVYGEAGFDLFRFSQENCSYTLAEGLVHYQLREIRATDALLAAARESGLRVMFGFFGFYEPRGQSDSGAMALEKRFVEYAIARWGVYVDLWELLNESHASRRWTREMADHVRRTDPYERPVTTSWTEPHLGAVDFNSPHWYESEPAADSDLRVVAKAAEWRSAGLPVLVGEQGNLGMNWDPGSALRMRVRLWTATFEEIALVFWNTSWAKDGMFHSRPSPHRAANLYLGPEERGYTSAWRSFASRLDAGVRRSEVATSAPEAVRAYGLRSKLVAAAYLRRFAASGAGARDLELKLELPGAAAHAPALYGEWFDPARGEVVACLEPAAIAPTLAVPPFAEDLALLVSTAPHRLHPPCDG